MLLRRRSGSTMERGARAVLLAMVVLAPVRAPAQAQSDGNDVVVVVAADSPVERLDASDLADLYLGRTSRFPDGTPAVPIDQREGAPARSAFYSSYLGRSAAQMKAHWSTIVFTGRGSPPHDVPDGAAARALIAADPVAIGYLERELVDASLKVVEVR
jgi:ABC-type phosphate transport system substrate-binding protein